MARMFDVIETGADRALEIDRGQRILLQQTIAAGQIGISSALVMSWSSAAR